MLVIRLSTLRAVVTVESRATSRDAQEEQNPTRSRPTRLSDLRERERERERVCVCVCVRERERACVCVRERERERTSPNAGLLFAGVENALPSPPPGFPGTSHSPCPILLQKDVHLCCFSCAVCGCPAMGVQYNWPALRDCTARAQ